MEGKKETKKDKERKREEEAWEEEEEQRIKRLTTLSERSQVRLLIRERERDS